MALLVAWPRRLASDTVVALGFTAWLIASWTGAWLMSRRLDEQTAFMRSDLERFVYWATLKTVCWVLPALALLRRDGADIRAVLLGERGLLWPLAWGLAGGLALASIAAVSRIPAQAAAASADQLWPRLNSVVVAPIVEELAFRGVVLRFLERGRRPFVANALTAMLFVASHVPGWWFQGRLLEMSSRTIGGAAWILGVGWVLGLVAQRSRSVAASIVAHASNNLCS
jgi:membrane protease YdiL (CAAX protease family)